MAFEVRETTEAGTVVVEPVGRLESKTSPELDKKIVALLAGGGRRFVVDLSATEYVSSAGLRVLLMLAKKLAGGAGRLALCGLNPQVREVFEIAGFAALFVIRPTRAEALAAAAEETGAVPSLSVSAKTPAARAHAAKAPTAPAESPAPPAAPAPAAPAAEPSGEDALLTRVLAAFGPAGVPHENVAADAALVERAAAALLAAR